MPAWFAMDAKSSDIESSKKAAALLRDGDLDGAAKQLDDVLQSPAQSTSKNNDMARNYYNRAQAYELQLQSSLALPLYEKAYTLQPDVAEYGSSYATALLAQDRLEESARVYERALKARAAGGPASITEQRTLAINLGNLGNL